MKTLLFTFLATSTLAVAGFKLPGKVFEVAELEKAKAEAQQKGKPIAILVSDKDTTCPLCSAASETIIRELGNKTVMVYARTKAELPAPAQEALRQGSYIPKVAVLNSTLDNALGTVTYEAIKADPRKAFRDVEKAIREYKK
jgi:hypothetical protein